MTIYLVRNVLQWYSSRNSWQFTQELTIRNTRCHAKVVGMPVKHHIQPQLLPHALFFVLPFSSSCKEKKWVYGSDCTSPYLYAVLLGLSPTSFSFLAVLRYTTFETCPEAAGANSNSKQIYFPRGKIHNFPSATFPVLLKTGWSQDAEAWVQGTGFNLDFLANVQSSSVCHVDLNVQKWEQAKSWITLF